MSILFAGGEPESFELFIGSTSSLKRDAFSRLSISLMFYTPHCIGNTFANQTSLWFSTYFIQTTAISADCVFIGLTTNGLNETSVKIGVKTVDTNGTMSIVKYDGATYTVLCISTLKATGLCKFDLQVINFGDSGTVRLYVDNVLFCEYTGDLTADASTYLNGFFLRKASSGSYQGCFSEIIVATDDTRLMSLKTLAPASAGDTNDWSGAYTDIDETGLSDLDYIYSDADDEVFTCNLTDMPAGTYDVKCVRIAARAADGVGGTDLKVGVKTNSEECYGDPQTLTGGWATYSEYFETNPVTSNPFTPAEIDALQLALKTAATP